MKITQLETIRLGEFPNIIWVRLHTDEGLVGLGETFMGAEAVEAWVWPVMKLIDDARRRADCFEAESYLARLRGQNERALRAVTSSVDSLVQGGITLDERYASALYQLALVHIQLGNNGFAYEQMLKARSVLNQLGLSGCYAWPFPVY